MNKLLVLASATAVLLGAGINNAYAANLAPSITAQPVNATVTAPAKATFAVTATGKPTPTYQWMESINGGAFTNITGATKASYTTAATTAADSGTQYECVITNMAGSVTSIPATLTVNVKPSITTQATSLTVIAPASAAFTIVASGTPAPSYQWMQKVEGGTYTNIPGATDASYTIAATTGSDSKTKYECVVSNAAGSVTSDAVKLTVEIAPSIITQPVDATVTAPGKAIFTVAATAIPKPEYQWMLSVNGGAFTNISGATKASYTTTSTNIDDSGNQYECVITNAAGSVTSAAATLTVNSTSVAPSITTQPTSLTVTAPATATFTVAASGTPAPTYQWMQEASGSSTFTAITGATNASYTTPATTTANSGTQYECVVTNTAGTVTSTAATLTVDPTPVAPSITTQPTSLTVTAPATATFTVAATGTPTPTYQWMQEASGAGTFTAITGATSVSYTTPATTVANNGTQYECVVTNITGSVTSNAATLTVNVVPTITTQSTSLTVTAPATATFVVAASGTPTPTYQWMESVSGGAYINIPGATSGTYTTPATTVANNGTQYECVITNAAGSVTSNPATLTVNIVPSITTQPVSVTVTSPATATFTIAATGTPTPTYQWMQEASGAGTFTAISGAISASYTTPVTTASNNGTQYECVVNNAVGSVTSNPATLTVNLVASITTQPVSTTVSAPATANFTVVASGTPALTYQWTQEAPGAGSFTAISGATSASYTTPATTTANSGTQYECIVSNTAGSVTSNAATLTVSGPPVITMTNPVNGSYSTSPVTFTVNASEINGTIVRVNYFQYEGGSSYALLGFSTTPPFTSKISLSLGGYTVVAQAVDSYGQSSAMTPRTSITVIAPPTVAIVSPVKQSTLTTGSVKITAIASENEGGISNVVFYNGTTLLGTVTSTTQAYTYTWPNIPSGTYSITAVATDLGGNAVTSLPVSFTINSIPFSYAIDNILLSKTDALSHTTIYQYDNDNRLLKTTFADGSTVVQVYDLFGNQISVTDQRGNTLTKTYDLYERLTQTKDPLGDVTQFSYDTNGDLLTLTDANGNPTTYTYDGDYRVLTQTNALNFTTTFSYDPDGNVASRTDANGKVTNYTYDALNRLTNTAYPDSTSVANVFDAIGEKTSMIDATGSTTYTYDALSRLLTKTSPGTSNKITYTYDSEGNRLTSVDQNNRIITNAYDALNRLSSVKDPNGTTSYNYDAASNKASVKTPNGVTESYTYDALNRALSTVNATNAGVISSFSNIYDIAGMITKKTLQDGSWTAYSYDALNRLLEETKQASSSIVYDYVYTYDPVGNRLTWTKNTTLGGFWSTDYLNMPSAVLTNMTNANLGNTANPTQAATLARNYTYDAANRLSNWNYAVNVYSQSFPVQTDTYTYDNNGNRLTKQAVLTGETSTPQQTNYSYDFENRLNMLTYTNIPNITGTQSDSLIYNGEGLRTQAVINSVASNYLYDGSSILVERNSSGATTKSYTRGLDFGGGIGSLINQNYVSNGTAVTQYYDYNDLGSTSDLTTSTGTSASSYSYDAFGNLLTPQASTDTNRYLFSTKEFDSRSGLDYFGARYYDPEIGRWLTQDPLGYTDGMNLYAYCHDNPVNCIDPTGLLGERITNWWDNNSTDIQGLFDSAVAIPFVGAGIEAVEGAGKVIVIGENMLDRVIPYAQSIGAEYYQPTQSILETGPVQALENNESWLIDKLNAGYRVIDRGIDPTRDARSVYYDMESKTYMEWKTTSGANK